jgi:hypothetical protein
MSRGATVRHIQFKTSTKNKPPKVSVSRALYEKPSGCVLGIKVTAERRANLSRQSEMIFEQRKDGATKRENGKIGPTTSTCQARIFSS